MSKSSDLLKGLTDKQVEAATLTGPVLVLAGAGTGKTKSLRTKRGDTLNEKR